MNEVTVERYVVNKEMHIGALRRKIYIDSVIEWEPVTETLKIDGHRIDRSPAIEPSEAMRQLKALSERNPESPAIKLLELKSEDALQGELKTQTLCVLPILGCLAAAKAHLEGKKGIPPTLTPVSDQQSEFLEMFGDLFAQLHGVPELESRSDDDVKVINAWLAERGFDIQLPPTSDPKGFAVASILDVLLKWLHEGKKTVITGKGGAEYTGVSLKDGVTVSHMAAVHPNPVARITTKNGDTVCMSMVDSVPEGIAGLFLKVADLEKVKATSHNYKGVSFPMIDLDERPDISWICGLGVGGGFRIETALQQTKFRMNEIGARVQSATGMTLARGMSSNTPHVIDRPFILWIKRDGIEFPLFAAVLCEDAWKEPKEL